VIDTEPRESFDVAQRRKLTEFARLAMDEIELAMKTRETKERSETTPTETRDSSHPIPPQLRGMTAVASEAGTIDPVKAGKDINSAVKSLEELDVVETAVTLSEKGGAAQLKFKYGRNTAEHMEASAKGVENATRKVTSPKKPKRPVKLDYPMPLDRASSERRPGNKDPTKRFSEGYRRPGTSLDRGYSSDPESPNLRPRRFSRGQSYSAHDDESDAQARQVQNLTILTNKPPAVSRRETKSQVSSSLEHEPPTKPDPCDRNVSSTEGIPCTPAMPSLSDWQNKHTMELAANLIARSLTVDFVYFMRLTPVTAKSPNRTGHPGAEVNLDLLGSYGLPYEGIDFSPFSHLDALRSEVGLTYNFPAFSGGQTGETADARDSFQIGVILPVWREYSRSSAAALMASMKSKKAAIHKLAGVVTSGKGSGSAGGAGGMSVQTLRQSCRKGVVVGVFSRRGDRKEFSQTERSYLKQWVTLRDTVKAM